MAFLLDTSILVRLANASDAQYPVAAQAVLELHRRGEVLHITPQVLIEFRNVATRPKSANGAGLPVADAESHDRGGVYRGVSRNVRILPCGRRRRILLRTMDRER